MHQARLELAAEFTADLRRIDAQLRETRKKLAVAVRASGSTVTEVFGVGPVIAATVTGDVRDVSRFASRDRFAACDGTAPIEVSSGNRKVHRLSLRGNRRLNHAIHMAAITQIRYEHSDGRACYDKKIAGGKTPKEALRALKRQISDAICKHLKADAARAAAAGAQGPGGHAGNDSVASAAGSHPERRLFGQATPGPVTTLRRPADQQKRASSHARKRPHEPLDTKRHRHGRLPNVDPLWSWSCVTGSYERRLSLPASQSGVEAFPATRPTVRSRQTQPWPQAGREQAGA